MEFLRDTLVARLAAEWSGWGAYVLLTQLQILLGLGATGLYLFARRAWGRDPRHERGETAGQWLRARIDAMRWVKAPVVLSLEGRPEGNFYWRRQQVIKLEPETFLGRGPGDWAVAAHELAHARWAEQGRITVWGFELLRKVQQAAAFWSALLLTANMLYRLPWLSELAIVGYQIAALLSLVSLVEEAVTSRTAYGILQGAGMPEPEALRAARRVLFAGWLTYFARAAAQVIVVFEQRWLLETILRKGPYVPAEPLVPEAAAGAAILTVFLLTLALYETLRGAKPGLTLEGKFGLKLDVLTVLRLSGVMALLGLVWDQDLGPVHILGCIAASFVVWPLLRGAMLAPVAGLVLPVTLVAMVLVGLLIWWAWDKAWMTHKPEKLKDPELSASKEQFLAAAQAEEREPAWYEQLTYWAQRLLHLPMLVVFWWLWVAWAG